MTWFFAPAPATRLAAVRLAVGLYATAFLGVWGGHLLEYGRMPPHRFVPVGLATLLDGPLPTWAVTALFIVTALLALPFTLGWRFRFTGPAFALAFLALLTYRHAWGMIYHSENLLVLHLLVLGVARASDAWALDRRGDPGTADWRYGWPLKLMALICVITYFQAGLSKVLNAGWAWGAGEILRNQVAYDALRKLEHGAAYSPLGVWSVHHAWLFPPLAALTLLIELGAPLALLHRRVAAVWAALIWCFHVGVLALMFILFAYPISGVAFLALFRAERPMRRVARWLRLDCAPAG